MEQLLRTGQTLNLSNKRKCVVENLIGSGTQGEVYRVKVDKNYYALKWYFKGAASKALLESLEDIVRKGAPTENFLWPLEVVKIENNRKSFGYLMNLRPKEYKSLSGWATMQFKMDFREQIAACLRLAESFHHLHAKGWSYQDISFGNIFIRPSDGDILICDNDNVTVSGKTVGSVMGTQRFMAPEIVTGKAKPSVFTDQYSLAVMLFYILMMSHPLEGKKEAAIKCFDIPAMNKIYGEEPVFIFDPKDDCNRPVKGIHNNALICWQVYPEFIKELFTRSFTKGLANPNARIRESQWAEAFVKLLNYIIYCQNCGGENFFDDKKYAEQGSLRCCVPRCGAVLVLPASIRIGGKLIMLNRDAYIYMGHIDMIGEDFTTPAAQVVQNPNAPNVWGLKNLSKEAWTYTNTANQLFEVPPGKSVIIKTGTKINFGKVIGEI